MWWALSTSSCPHCDSCHRPMSALGRSKAPSEAPRWEGVRRLIHKLSGTRAFWFGLTSRIVLPRIHCRTLAQNVLASGFQVRECRLQYVFHVSNLLPLSGSVLFSRSNLLKRKDLCFSCLRLGLIRHRRSLRSSHLFSSDLPRFSCHSLEN